MKKQFNGEITKPHRVAMAACACPFCKAPVGEPCPERRAAHPSRYQLRERMIRAYYDAEAEKQRKQEEAQWPDGAPWQWAPGRWYRRIGVETSSVIFSGADPKDHFTVMGSVHDTGRSFRWEVYSIIDDHDAGYARSMQAAKARVEHEARYWEKVLAGRT